MGVPYVEAESEAEAQCAQMAQAGLVHAVATEDMDALTFRATSLLRRLTMPEARKLPVQEINYGKMMQMLDLNHDEFVDLCILMGCDYVPSIKGIGPKKAIELIRKHKNIEAILKAIDTKKYVPPENWLYREARNLFKYPEVHQNIEPPKWTSPNVEECVKFLGEEKGFNEERIRGGLKRMEKSKGKTNQGRMDDFFKTSKIVSTKTPVKRKAGKQNTKNTKKIKTENKKK